MPKGKPRKTNPDLYAEPTTPDERSTAPKAAPHRRGGTHKVKDEDLTGTVFDTWNYAQLVEATKERKLYYKDMKKAHMIRVLADDHRRQQNEERIAAEERRKRNQGRKNEEERKAKAQQEQLAAERVEEEGRGERDEVVNDVTMNDNLVRGDHDWNEYAVQTVGKALSDYSTSSTSSDSTVLSVTPEILPACRLRLFEWTYTYMPPVAPSEIFDQSMAPDSGEPLPWICHYAPLKLFTMHSKQKLVLPGQKHFHPETKPVHPEKKYERKPGPDFAPALSLQERIAARNGVLQGTLAHAVIERGTDWARHTQVQGWNAMMYFKLPPRDENKKLADVYKKWNLEKRKLLRVKRWGDRDPKEREWRHAQIRRNHGRRTAEVFGASCYPQLAMGYLPAYLDFDFRKAEAGHVENNCTLENLFYIRFPACDLPHYYFWAQDEEWTDPTIPNPSWSWSPDIVSRENDTEFTDDEGSVTKTQTCRWIRYKKPGITLADLIVPSSATEFTSKLTKVERELYTSGLAPTLHAYRKKWLANGKERAWKIFARNLRALYPNGELPDAPPVHIEDDGATVAFKIATIDNLEDIEYPLLSPLRGNESWTRHDDEYWGIIDLDTDEIPQEKIGVQDFGDKIQDVHTRDEEPGLYRRSSMSFQNSPGNWEARLNQISPSQIPSQPMTLIEPPVDDDWISKADQEWEERFLRPEGTKKSHFCLVCCMNWVAMTLQAQTQHILSHGTIKHIHRRRNATKSPSPLTLPPFTRKHSRHVYDNTFYDAGVDGDLDTPIRPASYKRYRATAKARARPQSSKRTLALDASQTHISSPSLEFLTYVPSKENRKVSRRHKHRLSDSGQVQSLLSPQMERHSKRKRENEENSNDREGLSFLDSYVGSQKKRRRIIARVN